MFLGFVLWFFSPICFSLTEETESYDDNLSLCQSLKRRHVDDKEEEDSTFDQAADRSLFDYDPEGLKCIVLFYNIWKTEITYN